MSIATAFHRFLPVIKLGIATVMVDFVAVNLLPKKRVYENVKFKKVDEDEEERKMMYDGVVADYGTAGRPAREDEETASARGGPSWSAVPSLVSCCTIS